jgi:hypothetical protein
MTYTELVAASKAYADRNDFEVSSNMDTFIILTEAKINRLLKTRKQSTRSVTPTVFNQEYYALPEDYSGMRNIQLNSSPNNQDHSVCTFHLVNPDQLDEYRSKPYGGKLYYCVIANQFQIYPKQDAGKQIEIAYYQKVPNLKNTVTNNENWMSMDHPDIYLSGMCAEISLFAKDYQAADGWTKRMGIAVGDLDESDTEERWSAGPLQMRLG